MTMEELLKELASLADRYETSHGNRRILSLVVKDATEESDFEYVWEGQEMIKCNCD